MNNCIRTIVCLLLATTAVAQTKPAFKVVPLGVHGGSDEDNLSAYMVAPAGSNAYVCMDGGTVHSGIQKAIASHIFNVPADTVMVKYIKGYCISHPHLDHVAGMLINSPDDVGPKYIYGLPYTLNVLRDNYFTWKSWANFGSDGDKPVLNKYHYTPLVPGTKTTIQNTSMTVQAFALSHGNPYESAAFLVGNNSNYILYLGDTGADEIEKSDKLHQLWAYVAPMIRSGQLKTIMIEVSFPNSQPNGALFGHLTPKLLMNEMQALSQLAGAQALANFPIVITHLKPHGGHIPQIKSELAAGNALKLKLIYPDQGRALEF